MILGGRSLQELSLDDLQTLIENQVAAGQSVDYGSLAGDEWQSDLDEILRDVTAFGNAEGGYVVLGVERDGASLPTRLSPFDDPEAKAQTILQACYDYVREPIAGLEVRAFSTGFNQGVVVVRVPPSVQRPHMTTRDNKTEFVAREGAASRALTIGEIREFVLQGAGSGMVAPTISQQARSSAFASAATTEAASYTRILTENTVEKFLQRYFVNPTAAQSIVIVSPFISDLAGERYELKSVLNRICADRARAYVITRPPREAYHQVAVQLLHECARVELRYNPDIHAKLYICWHREEEESFALFGSGNLTPGGMRHNIELGMLILARGPGRKLIRDLYDWSTGGLRTKSQRVKAIQALQ